MVVQTEYNLITKDYEEHIDTFNFKRLVILRKQIDYCLSHITEKQKIEKIKLLNSSLKAYPDSEDIFLSIRPRKAGQHQLAILKETFNRLEFNKVLDLITEYTNSGYIPPYELAYYRVMSQYRLFLKSPHTRKGKQELLESLATYQKEYTKKSIIYDRVIDDSIKNVKKRR